MRSKPATTHGTECSRNKCQGNGAKRWQSAPNTPRAHLHRQLDGASNGRPGPCNVATLASTRSAGDLGMTHRSSTSSRRERAQSAHQRALAMNVQVLIDSIVRQRARAICASASKPTTKRTAYGESHSLIQCEDSCAGSLDCIAGVCTRGCVIAAAPGRGEQRLHPRRLACVDGGCVELEE